MVDTLACRVRQVDVQTLYYPLVKVDAETLIYALTDRLSVVKTKKKLATCQPRYSAKRCLTYPQTENQRLRSTHLVTHCPS